MRIEFVSDVVCPWCAIGLASLQEAVRRLDGAVPVELEFRPFELNPQMAPEGEDIGEHLSRKYGLSPAQLASNREAIVARGAALGFRFGARERTWNTFDAHRLLHWAGLQGRQLELKTLLLQAYHGQAQNVSDHAVLRRLAAEAGLDEAQAARVLEGDDYASEVRQAEQLAQAQGISSVPSMIIDGRYLITGGQPPEVFEQALRQIAAEAQGKAADATAG
jgi:predicted DsbA family dithiol-disulfide isomerase